MTHQEMLRKARAGAFRGEQYGGTSVTYGGATGSNGTGTAAGMGSGIVKKRPLSNKNTGHSPYVSPYTPKPGR